MDTSNILILSNLQKPWTIACKDISRVFEIEYSTYCILNRLELCKCSLTAGNYLLSQTDTNCGDMPEAREVSGESNLTNRRTAGKNPHHGIARPFIVKGHVTNAHALL